MAEKALRQEQEKALRQTQGTGEWLCMIMVRFIANTFLLEAIQLGAVCSLGRLVGSVSSSIFYPCAGWCAPQSVANISLPLSPTPTTPLDRSIQTLSPTTPTGVLSMGQTTLPMDYLWWQRSDANNIFVTLNQQQDGSKWQLDRPKSSSLVNPLPSSACPTHGTHSSPDSSLHDAALKLA